MDILADGKVVIDTELDPKGAESGMSKLGGTLAKVGSTAVKGAAIGVAAIGTSAVIAGKGLFDMAVQMADTGDNIGEMSEKIGISTKAYQEWGYILGQNGADVDILQMGIKTLSSAIFDASNGSQSAIDKFEYLGLSIDDLKNKSQEEIFDTVIAGLQKMPESAERTALAVDLLGKSATELQPILNKSADEITAYKDEAAELGFVMGEDTLQASSDLMDSIDNLQKSFMGAKNGIVGEFIPSIGLIVDGITEVVKGNEDGTKMIEDGFNQLVQGLTSALPKIITFLNQVLSVILQNAPTIITTLIQGIIQSLPLLAAFLPQIVFALVDGIMLLLPALLSVGLQIIITLMQGLVGNLPIMLPQLLQVIETIITMLTENLPLFVELAVQIIEIMATAILENQDMLVRVMSVLIQAMIQIIATLIPQAIQMVIDLVAAMMLGMSKMYPEVIKQGIEIVKSIMSGFSSFWENMKKLTVQKFKELPAKIKELNGEFINSGVNIAKGIIDGFAQKIGEIIGKVIDMKNQVAAQLADFNPLGAIGDAVKNGVSNITANMQVKSDATPAQSGRPSNTMSTPSTNVYINTSASKLFNAVVEQNNGYSKGGYTPLASY